MMNYLRLATTYNGYFKQGETIVPASGRIATLTPSFISPFSVATTISSESLQITGIYFQRMCWLSLLSLIPFSLIGFIAFHIGVLIYTEPAPILFTLAIIATIFITMIFPLFHVALLLMWSQSPSPCRRYLIRRHYPNIPTYTVSRKFLKKV